MAIAKTKTMLSLDRYAKIFGINPVWFNGGGTVDLADGSILFPIENNQNQVWPQYSWQNADMTSREELAMEIARSEKEIVEYLGFFPVYDWVEAERHFMPRNYRPELSSYRTAYDVGGKERAVPLRYSYFVRGGRRAKTLVAANALVTMADADLDGWNEIATVTVAAPAAYGSLEEIKMYFSGHAGDDAYEIREFKTKVLAGANIVFTLNAWMLIDPDLVYDLPTNSGRGRSVDMNDSSTFVANVDVYRVYNDYTQNHALFHVPDTITELEYHANGFLYQIDPDFVVPVDGEYTAGSWTRNSAEIGYSDYVDLWYYSGMKETLSDDFAVAIAYMTTARLERIFYANNNATAMATHLREYMNESEREGASKLTPQDALTNPFGLRRGEWMAWKMINRYKQPYRTGGSL